MNTTLQTERRETFKEIYGVETFSEILELFKKDYNKVKNTNAEKGKELFRDYSYAIYFMYTPSTIRNNLVKFKNVIKEAGGKYEKNIYNMFTVDAVYAPIKKRDTERKEEKKELIMRGENTKINPQVTKDKIRELEKKLTDKDYSVGKNQSKEQVRVYIIFTMLGLATGRRFAELLKTLKFSKRKHNIYFEGLLKGNEKKIVGHIIELTYQEARQYLNELRAFVQTNDMTIAELNPRYARIFNNSIKKLVGVSAKELRREYAIAGSELFKEGNESVEQTITRILGHKEVLTSALNYT